uniref:Uncharacterized protein n=1 Tax=Arundo donax TaxID=35708 RepID=A0A0A9EBZ4_ARUDO
MRCFPLQSMGILLVSTQIQSRLLTVVISYVHV